MDRPELDVVQTIMDDEDFVTVSCDGMNAETAADVTATLRNAGIDCSERVRDRGNQPAVLIVRTEDDTPAVAVRDALTKANWQCK